MRRCFDGQQSEDGGLALAPRCGCTKHPHLLVPGLHLLRKLHLSQPVPLLLAQTLLGHELLKFEEEGRQTHSQWTNIAKSPLSPPAAALSRPHLGSVEDIDACALSELEGASDGEWHMDGGLDAGLVEKRAMGAAAVIEVGRLFGDGGLKVSSEIYLWLSDAEGLIDKTRRIRMMAMEAVRWGRSIQNASYQTT